MLSATPHHHGRSTARGLTMIELLIVSCVVTIFLLLMMPSFRDEVIRVRRADAWQAIQNVLQSQERWRAEQRVYAASLSELGLTPSSPEGHYTVNVETDVSSQASRYVVNAAATGAQSGDGLCRHLRIIVEAGRELESSGPDTRYGNDAATNRRCWNRR